MSTSCLGPINCPTDVPTSPPWAPATPLTPEPPTPTSPPPAPATTAPPPPPTTTATTTTAPTTFTPAPPAPPPPPPSTTTAAPPLTATPDPTDVANTTTPTPSMTSTTSTTSSSSLSDAPPEISIAPPTRAVESVASTPAPAIAASKTSVSRTTIATAGGGGFVVLVVVVIIILLVRRKRSSKPNDRTTISPGKAEDDDVGYTNFSRAPTEHTNTQSGNLESGYVLAGKRIPIRALRFGEVISQGGFGEVVKGTYNSETVAIKRLLAVRRKDKENTDSFFEEIKLTSTLHHECLVRFIGYAWDVPSNLCMVSEFMEGGDLRTLMVTYSKSGHSNGHDDGKLRILEQVACALQYLHALEPPIVHRDLKSRNVLLSSEGDAKLIDFGISCERQDVTMTAGVGTSMWMAPEVMLGQRYDEKADVFSFGVILSELDTHTLPYHDARDLTSNGKLSNVKLTQLISSGRIYPRFTSWADPAIVALARECLQLSPALRPSASAVVSRLTKIRRSELTNTRTRTHTGILSADPREVTRDSVLSFGSQASARTTTGPVR